MQVDHSDMDKAWLKVLSMYMAVGDLFRLRLVSKNLGALSMKVLHDDAIRKVVRSDEALAALERLSIYPPIVQLEGNRVTHDGVSRLMAAGVIRTLRIVDCDNINDQTVTLLAENNGMTLRNFEIDCRAPNLAFRNGYNGTRPMVITDRGIRQLATNCPHMQSFVLRWSRQITDDSLIEVFRSSKQLEALALHWSKVSDRSLQALANSESVLKDLDIRTCKEVSDHGISAIFHKQLQLRSLSLVDIPVTDHGLTELVSTGRAKTLQSLFLSDLESITDAGLKTLAGGITDKLTSLHLSHLKRVTNDGIIALLSACTGLVSLDIAWMGIGDDALKGVSNAPSAMKSLRVARFDGLKEVTDAGLTAFVKTCSRLGIVECFNSKATEACARSLSGPNLNVIMAPW